VCQGSDGVLETAVEEADKALKRGCDVTMVYRSADGKRGHMEMVKQIVVDPTNSQEATGKLTVAVVPRPAWLLIEIRPPCISAIFATTASPNPTPCCS
jgi:hypothetical protein